MILCFDSCLQVFQYVCTIVFQRLISLFFVLSFWDGMCSDEELFLSQNSFYKEILQHNFSIDSNLDGLVASDDPASRNSCVRSLQKYQHPETSTKIEFSKAFDSSEAMPFSDCIGSEKAPLKHEVEVEEETICKFSKGCDKAGIPETKPVTFNQCTFIISEDWKLN